MMWCPRSSSKSPTAAASRPMAEEVEEEGEGVMAKLAGVEAVGLITAPASHNQHCADRCVS